MSHRWRLAQWLALIALGVAIALVVAPGHRSVALGAGVMALLAVLLVEMATVAHRLAQADESLWERVRRVPERKSERPGDLERIERGLGWGRYSIGDFNYRVRPMLRRLAAQRLKEAHGIDVDDRSAAARAVVSDELWDHVIAKQPPEREGALVTGDIARMVDEIEAL